MSFSYDDSLPTELDEVRSNIGDVRSAEVLLTDELIEAVLTKYGDDVILSTAECCLKILAKLARDTTVSGSAGSQQRKEKVDRYKELYLIYSQLAGSTATPFVGGASITENDDLRADTDLVQPSFTIGGDDYRGTDPESEDDT